MNKDIVLCENTDCPHHLRTSCLRNPIHHTQGTHAYDVFLPVKIGRKEVEVCDHRIVKDSLVIVTANK